jgi:hypothetical protein
MSWGVRERFYHLWAEMGPDDLQAYSNLVVEAYPNAVYFLTNFKKNFHYPPAFPDSKPIRLHRSLSDAIENDGYSDPDVRMGVIGIRDPWPEDVKSGLSEDLIGGRFCPGYGLTNPTEMRRYGKYVQVVVGFRGYRDAATYYKDASPTLFIEEIGTLKHSDYPAYSFMEWYGMGVELSAYYDANDSETSAFCRSMANLWRRCSTRTAALYDPVTGALIDANYQAPKPVGRIALRQAIDGSGRITDFHVLKRGVWAIVGERPKKTKSAKAKSQ